MFQLWEFYTSSSSKQAVRFRAFKLTFLRSSVESGQQQKQRAGWLKQKYPAVLGMIVSFSILYQAEGRP